jgi:CRP/FNR family transcriptional regulator
MAVISQAKCKDCFISRGGICADIEPRTRALLGNQAVTHQFNANQIVWDGEHAPPFVGIVVSGYLRLQRYSFDGRRQIISLLKKGDVIGGLSRTQQDFSIEAATDAAICKIERRVFERMMEQDRALQRAVYDVHVAKLEELRWLTWSLGGLAADERLTAFLVMATTYMPYQPQPDGSSILTVDLPRHDIADLLGTSVESISRISKRLEAAGAIEIISARHFRIPDLQALIKLGCLEDTFDRMRSAMLPQAMKRFFADQIQPQQAAKAPDAAHPQHLKVVGSVGRPTIALHQ